MNKNLEIVNKILKLVYIVGVIIFTTPLLYTLILGWVSYISHTNVLGTDFHQFFGIVSNQLSTYQLFWIIGQTLFLFLLFISVFLINRVWWFYYIWLILVIEFVITNLQKLNLIDLFFWIPLIYTIILYFVNHKIKKI